VTYRPARENAQCKDCASKGDWPPESRARRHSTLRERTLSKANRGTQQTNAQDRTK